MEVKMNEIDQYIKGFPGTTQVVLQRIRKIIKDTAPQAIEHFAYGMPAYRLNGKPLVYFAGFSKHIGFYATPSGHSQFSEELSNYKQGKGSVQFPINKPIPYELIKKIVEFRIYENLQKKSK